MHARALGVLRDDADGGGPVPRFHRQLALDYAARDLAQKSMGHQLQIALRNLDRASADHVDSAVNQVNELMQNLHESLVPWTSRRKTGRKPIDPKDARDIQARWDKAFGGMDNPTVQAKLEKLQQTLNKSRGNSVQDLQWVRRI